MADAVVAVFVEDGANIIAAGADARQMRRSSIAFTTNLQHGIQRAVTGGAAGTKGHGKKLRLEHEPKPGDIITVEVFDRLCKVTVVSITDTKITVDGNHPLAGETITYEITIVKILKNG